MRSNKFGRQISSVSLYHVKSVEVFLYVEQVEKGGYGKRANPPFYLNALDAKCYFPLK